MSVRIRMSRVGRKNFAQWRIGIFDKRTRRDGRMIESLGTYDPHQVNKDQKVVIDVERYHHWVSKGAVPSDSVKRLLNHTESLAAK